MEYTRNTKVAIDTCGYWFFPLFFVRFVFCDWPHFVKTSVLARCCARCLDMLVRHRGVPCFAFLEDLF